MAYWMPRMECFFIDLLLDHMRRGNRVGYSFNKQAWADMLIVFNAKFRSQYDKDFLKNHYTTLWKQFKDINNILDQSGFFWDDNQQMVVADDHLWDAYIKANPEGQYYKNKAVMNFNYLRLIFAYKTADGRYSRSSHDVDLHDETQGVNIGEGKEGHTPTIGNCSRTYWTPLMDSYLIDLVLDQVQRGRRIAHVFMTQAWNEMVTLFNVKFGSHFDKEILENQYKDLKYQYNDIKILLHESGFSWDETHEMIMAEDYVWDSYSKAYPDARLYKSKTVPNYHKLCGIYEEEGSNGLSSHMVPNQDLNSENPVLMIDNDFLRSGWTPSMERYLIDLMLDQVHKGLRINPIFNKQAWIRIVAAFNDRFGAKHSKYVLRCRHRGLRKLYNDMKDLLDQSEFSWDETQQMVVASDGVWDVFIKEHQDVKLFRNLTKPNYNDLCLIYGNWTSGGKLNLSDQDANCNYDGRNIQALGCQGNDWIPLMDSMDRYFIDLMLEQIRRGSMVDQKFSKQAWHDMVPKFNAKFGFKHHKGSLKSRFKNLSKKFNDMKDILGQRGFEWDEMQQMITAKDDIWNAYITANPDARSYRSRTLPNYNDLFLIYGKTYTNGAHICSHHSIYIDEDVLGVHIGEHDCQSSAGRDILVINWTNPMDRFFIDLMLEQVFEGNKINHTFKNEAWVYMITSFNERFGLHFGKYELQNRYLRLINLYKDISHFLNVNGFAWGEIQQVITADDDIWKAFIKEHPDAVIYKDTVLDSKRHLSIILGNGIQDGRSSFLDGVLDTDGNTLKMGKDRIFEDVQSTVTGVAVSDQRKKRRFEAPLTSAFSRKIKKSCKESLEDGERSNAPGNNYSSMETIVDALQAIPDMDDELFLDACNLLEDEKKAKAFVKMDIEQRKKWLIRKLHL